MRQYKAYMKSDRRKKTPVITAKSYDAALEEAAGQLNTPASNIELVEATRLVCDRCGYVWDYLGFRRVFATCPQCIKQVRIETARKS